MWEWNFNSKGAGDTYTSCWEADIVANINERDSKLSQRQLPTRQPGNDTGVTAILIRKKPKWLF